MNSAAKEITVDHQEEWRKHICKATTEFLKTAVVIDNEPWVVEQVLLNTQTTESVQTSSSDTGIDGDEYVVSPPETPISPARIDIRTISDVFIENGISCSFVLPEDNDTDYSRKKSRAVSAARLSDITIIDWFLIPKDPSLTLQVIDEIAQQDKACNGRLRLLCIYTGETIQEHMLDAVIAEYQKHSITLQKSSELNFSAQCKDTIIVFKNKTTTPANRLPNELITLFSKFANGLLPSFVLAAAGAIRKNMHHMVTRFEGEMDAAYVANRLITNPPGDVAELIRELFVAECDNAIGFETVADDYLDIEPITKWINVNEGQFKNTHYQVGEPVPVSYLVDQFTILSLLKNGINDRDFVDLNNSKQPFAPGKRVAVSQYLAGSIEKSNRIENKFSRLVALKRELHELSSMVSTGKWLPTLTTGTILRLNTEGQDRYFMCLTPACDSLRLSGDKTFVFLEGVVKQKGYSLVVKSSDGQLVSLYFDNKRPLINSFIFKADSALGRVIAVKQDANSFIFTSSQPTSQQFQWVAELRYSRAVSEMAKLASNWMRLGILDSEYLRLASQNNFKFSPN